MKKLKSIMLSLLFVGIIISNNTFAQSNDFTSKNITLENDKALTMEYGYPVIRVKNITNNNLDVTYSFYVHESDSSHYNNNFIIKANDELVLKVPELAHLGSTNKTRTIWFSWNEEDKLKPQQNQIETIPFESVETEDNKEPQLG